MRMWKRWRNRRAVEQEMHEEMEFHLEARIATLLARGMTHAEAQRTARIEFGSVEAHREECRAALGYRPWDELRADLRYAVRMIGKQPGYSATAVAILALAIGVNSAFFILFSHHVLKPLSIRGAERHFDLRGMDNRGQSTGGWLPLEIETLAGAGRQYVEGLYTSRTVQVLVLEPEQRLSLVSFVSGNYFGLLGGQAAAGRTFGEREQRDPVAVLSNSGWRRLFAADAAPPVGRQIRLRTTVFTVIGVMPEAFTGTEAAVPDLWVGAEMDSALLGADNADGKRYGISGLLAPGVSLEQAEAILTLTAARFPRPASEQVASVQLKNRSGFVAADEDLRIAAALVFAAFLTVLAIACANLANLGLARAASRTHEIGMRLTLGASRGRIVRQLLTESTCIAMLGALGGVGIGALAVEEAQRYLLPLAGGMGITMLPVNPDWRVLIFSGLLGMVAGLAFGLLPAIESTSTSLTQSTKREHSAFAGRVRPRRMRSILMSGQVASSLVLLVIAGVLVRHVQRLAVTATGYDLDRIYDLKLDRPQPALVALLAREPSIASVTAVAQVPLYGGMAQVPARVGGQSLQVSHNVVDERYFETLALPVQGRGFTALEAARNERVAVISQATARKLWPGGGPALGQILTIDVPNGGPHEVIGVVPDVVSGWLFRGKDATAVYLPGAAGQDRMRNAMVRIHTGPPAAALLTIRKLCANAVDAGGCEPASLREVSNLSRFPFAAGASVAGLLGLLALLLTAIGLYSVTSYSVIHRRREIGVHLALGASPARVLRRIGGEALRCVLAGVLVGIPVCLVISRLMEATVLGIAGFDGWAYAAVAMLLAAIVTLACAVPAARAARIDPMASLREE